MARFTRFNRRSAKGYAPVKPQALDVPHVALLEAAQAASDRRNAENYAWVSDCGAGAAQKQVDHFTRLIALVGDADTAWRAYRAAMGQDYGTLPSNTPHDLGWLPRYTEGLERARARLAEEEQAELETAERVSSCRTCHATGCLDCGAVRDSEDSGLSQQWLDYPDSDAGGL